MEKTFGTLKSAFTSAPILRLFNPFKRIIIEINASDYALKAVLFQKGLDKKFHPIAFYSWKVIPAGINYKIHDKKLLTIIKAFKKWYYHFKEGKYKIEVFIYY